MSGLKFFLAKFVSMVLILPAPAFAQIFSGLRHSQNSCASYTGLIKSYGFNHYWRLNEKSGTTAADSIGTNTATYVNAPTLNQPGPLVISSQSVTLNGSSQEIQSSSVITNPTTLTLVVWFKTTVGGGKLIGFGNASSGTSSSYDRHIYMSNAGIVHFGVYNGSANVVKSTATFKDGLWHMAAATFGPAGMKLYIDGGAVETNNVSTVTAFNGYWRIGRDHFSGWLGADGSEFFAGSLSEVSVANSKAMSAAEISTLYNIGKGCKASDSTIPKVVVTSALYGFGGTTCNATSAVAGTCADMVSCSVTSSNSLCGDPTPGQGKTLTVNYTCGATAKSTSGGEGAVVTMSCP